MDETVAAWHTVPVVPCEGRCGSRLFPAEEADGKLRERGIATPGWGDWAPFHDVTRCRAIRGLREALQKRCPDAMVDIMPARHFAMLYVLVSRENGGELHAVSRYIRDEMLFAADSAPAFVEAEVESVGRRLDAQRVA